MRCQDDLTALTRFVTWDLQERSSGALKRSLPDQTDMVAIYKVAVKIANEENPKQKDTVSSKGKGDETTSIDNNSLSKSFSETLTPINNKDVRSDRDYYNLLQLMEEAACSRDANRTNMVVGGLVQHIVSQWRETFCTSVTTKFNCYFLMPFVENFHSYLRSELQKVYDGEGDNLNSVFDLTSARKTLLKQREELISECKANKRLQEKFDMVSSMMREQQEKTETFSQ